MVEKKAVQINSLPPPPPPPPTGEAFEHGDEGYNAIESSLFGENEGDEDVMGTALDFDAAKVETQDLKAMGLAAGGKLSKFISTSLE